MKFEMKKDKDSVFVRVIKKIRGGYSATDYRQLPRKVDDYYGYYIVFPNKIPNGEEIFKDSKFIYKEGRLGDPLNGPPWTEEVTLGVKFTKSDLKAMRLVEGMVVPHEK